MRDRRTKFVLALANAGYVITATILFIVAIWIVVASVIKLGIEIAESEFTVYNLLDEVALVVFAFAVIDVSKYLLCEEVLRNEYERNPKQSRKALTKLVVIIFTALSLESLVLTIEMAKANIQMIVYPALLLLVTTLYLGGFGVYQWFSSKSEK